MLLTDTDMDQGDTLSATAISTSGTSAAVVRLTTGFFTYAPAAMFDSLAVTKTATSSFRYWLGPAPWASRSRLGATRTPVVLRDGPRARQGVAPRCG